MKRQRRSHRREFKQEAVALVVKRAAKHKVDRLSQWMTGLATRQHPNVAVVALANKTVRMAWVILNCDVDY
jgi:transposase